MRIFVEPHKVTIDKKSEPINEKEINISKCTFEFSKDMNIPDDYVKEAYFTLNDKTHKKIILNNECKYPDEVLETSGILEVGVSVYKLIDENTFDKLYNPLPDYFETWKGSLKEAENSVPVTPTDKQQMEQMLANINIDATKEDGVTTITYSNKDGIEKEVEILDGEQGEQGPQGDPGYTPQKGIDYFTDADIASLNIPRKTSDLNNDSGFIDNSTDSLVNYYKKTETYNKTEIDGKISSVYKYKGSVATYEDLPNTDLTIGDVYNVESDGSNYAWNGTAWDKLGGEVDLSNYYNKTETNTLLNGKVDNSTLNDYYTKTRTDELLGAKYSKPVSGIPKTDLASGVQDSLGLADTALQSSDLTDYVKNTDYASDSKGGVVKVNSNLGIGINSSLGNIYARNLTYAQYGNTDNLSFISKGTLENVITGKDLTTKAYVDGLVGDIGEALDLINGEVIGGA